MEHLTCIVHAACRFRGRWDREGCMHVHDIEVSWKFPHLSLTVIRGFLKWYALYKSTFYLLTLLTYRHSATENCDDAGYITDNTSAGGRGPGPHPGNIPYIDNLIDANIQHSFPPRSTLTAVWRFQLLARWPWTRSAVRMWIPMVWVWGEYGGQKFRPHGSPAWNSLPDFLRDPTSSTDCFRRHT